MPYCPKCRDEFQDWVDFCPDCNVSLVIELPAKPDSKQIDEPLAKPESEYIDEPLVHIATAPNESIAMFWKGILEGEGIHSVVASSDLTALVYISPFLSRCAIYVFASQVERAKQIIAPLLED